MGLETKLSQIVSETEALVKPAIQAISPATISLTGILLFPSKENNFVSLPFSTRFWFRFIALTILLTSAFPLSTFPIKHLPT